jgi:hypothetical protein
VNIVIDTLQKKFFELAEKENYPNTPDITSQLDILQNEIKRRKELEK